MHRVNSTVARHGTKPILPGRVEPTWRQAQWSREGDRLKELLPTRASEGPLAVRGQVICPVCHAISDSKHWRLNEQEYGQLRRSPDVKVELCPADQRILRQMYDGEVVLQGGWLANHREEVLNWIRNEEKRTRDTNPMARLASVEQRDDSVYILTTTQALARRIGSGLKSAFKGRLKIQRLPYEAFTRVRWARD